MKPATSNLVMHACPRCGGAAYLEDPYDNDWRCLQCARSIPASEVMAKLAQKRAA